MFSRSLRVEDEQRVARTAQLRGVEPKVAFAVERVCLYWYGLAALLVLVAIQLLSGPSASLGSTDGCNSIPSSRSQDRNICYASRSSGTALMALAIVLFIYGSYRRDTRTLAILTSSGRFDDERLVSAISVCLIVVFCIVSVVVTIASLS